MDMKVTRSTASFGKLLIQRKNFIGAVYLVLCIQLAITFIIAKYLRNHQDIYKVALRFFIPLLITPFLIIFAMPYFSQGGQFILFSAFSFILGILSIGASQYVSTEIIEVALISAVSVFLGMTLIGLGLAALGYDLSFMGFVLLAALIGLLVVRTVFLFVPVSSEKYKNVATFSIVLFSIFVGFDTNRMLQKNYNIGIMQTAMGFYLDIENLFVNFVEMGLNNN